MISNPNSNVIINRLRINIKVHIKFQINLNFELG